MLDRYSKNGNNIFFIVGFPRSGTTLLSNILNNHSDVFVTAETHFFREFQYAFVQNKLILTSDLVKHARLLRINDLGINDKTYSKLFEGIQYCTACEFFRKIMFYLQKKNGKLILGEKSPIHQLFLLEISKCFPKAKIIYILRDGRDTVLSLQKVKWTHNNYIRHCLEWEYRTERTLSLLGEINNESILVKYEDILANPILKVEEICDFLNVKFELKQLDNKNNTNSNVVPEWEKEWKGKALEKIDEKRMYAWKRNLSEFNKVIMTTIMKNNLDLFGYDINFTNAKKFVYLSLVTQLVFNQYTYKMYRRSRDFGGLLKRSLNLKKIVF